MITLQSALCRTLLLMRDELRGGVDDGALLDALTTTRVALVADEQTLSSPTAQTAFVTAAMLCVRSGHEVYLVAPDMPLQGCQPPFAAGTGLLRALMEADGRIVPRSRFVVGQPLERVDLEIRLGSTARACASRISCALIADSWSARLGNESASWPNFSWPMGALAGAAIVATEAFKCAMRRLRAFARDPLIFDELFAHSDNLVFELAPRDAPVTSQLGTFDVISAGAITNATLYALSRLPSVQGHARIFEPDCADISNLNRYALLLLDHLGKSKTSHINELKLGGLSIDGIAVSYRGPCLETPLRSRVLVGVDDIPTRWSVQRENPTWLGIGASTHWSAMASFHTPELPCAGCLHPYDDPADGPIPTAAFVSFMAGLLQATYFLRDVAGYARGDQHTYITMLRPETVWRGPVARHRKCPVMHSVAYGGRTTLTNIEAVAR